MRVNAFLQDFRGALRALRRSPGFTLTAALVLAVGIGATTAIFSVVNGVLLRPFPYAEPDRLVLVWERATKLQLNVMWVAYPNYLDWEKQNRSFSGTAAFAMGSVALTGAGDPEQITSSIVTPGFFGVLGVEPALGRVFGLDDDRPGAARTTILSHGLWRRRFGGDPAVVGRAIRLDGESYTVVGVMPDGFEFPPGDAASEGLGGSPDAWAPMGLFADDPEMQNRGNHPGLSVIARLAPGVTLERARADMQALAAGIRAQHPENIDDGVTILPLRDAVVGLARVALPILLGAVGLLLLIACANVAGLLVARGTARERELAIRASLGATRGRIVGQLLAESLVLALVGGGVGLLLAHWAVAALLSIGPAGLPLATRVGLDPIVSGFTAAIALLAAVLAGLAPALQASRGAPVASLADGGRRSTPGRSAWRLRQVVVAAQLALTVLLLAGAGLLIRSLTRAQAVNPGFDARGVLTLDVLLPARRYAEPARQQAFFTDVLERVSSLPGVVAAGAATDTPLSGAGRQSGLRVESQPAKSRDEIPLTDIQVVSPNYFRAMGIDVTRGRAFTRADNGDSPRVAIVDAAVLRRFWPGGNPIGERIAVDNDEQGNPIWREVVGVAGAVKSQGLDEDARMLIYVPYLQNAEPAMTIVLRARGDAAGLAPAARRAVWAVDPEQPVASVRLLGDLLADSLAPRRLNAALLAAFAAAALILSAVGAYGVVSTSVARRTQEIGVRVALGARRVDVLGLVLRQGLRPALAGIAVGVVGALAGAPLLASLLYGVTPGDVPALGVAPLVMAGVAALACWLPARRAARVDPMTALRVE
jgi:putative ABC transport system permease protein